MIIGLQTNRSRINTSLFNHCNIKNAFVRINGELSPQELLNLDISNNESEVLYDVYQNMRRVISGDECYLGTGNFFGVCPLIVLAHLYIQQIPTEQNVKS